MFQGGQSEWSLPGSGIPSGIDSGLYGFPHGTSRRKDSSVPERSRVRTSECWRIQTFFV